MLRLCPRVQENNVFFNCLFLNKLPRSSASFSLRRTWQTSRLWGPRRIFSTLTTASRRMTWWHVRRHLEGEEKAWTQLEASGRQLGFSSSNHYQGAAGLLGHGEFLQKISAQHRPRPLTDGLRGCKKGADKLEWLAAMDDTFAGAKQALLSATHLAHPTVVAELSVVVDASATHVGACLQQQLPGRKDWQPLGFFS